jgi:DNA-binding transcriptional LysR family regulator
VNIELIRTFLEVERLRHFGRAAEELHVSQAAVSARIRQLEELLGVSLFDRGTRETQLTPAGNRLLPHAESLLADWRKARQAVALDGSDQQVAVGGSLRLWHVLMQDWLQRLRRQRPQLAILAESHAPDQLNQRLLDGVLDFAVMLEPAQLQSLQIRPVAQIELVLVASRSGLSVPAALSSNYIYVDWGLAHAVEHRRHFPDAAESRTRVGQPFMALGLLRDLGGAAYLPLGMVTGDLDEGRLSRVADAPVMTRTAFAVYPVRTGRLAIIEECLAFFGDPPDRRQRQHKRRRA